MGMVDYPIGTPDFLSFWKGYGKKTVQRRYHSYLLRLWQTSDRGEQVWRASLESPGTGERRGFASLKDLFSFLQARTEPQDRQNSQDTQG